MKKLFSVLAAVFMVAAVSLMTSCVQNYGGAYPELQQYYCCWGDSVDWNDHSDPSKTLMTYDAGTATYSIIIETKKKNQRFEITKGPTYTVAEYCYYDANSKKYYQDEANKALFPKYKDNGVNGSLHSVLPQVGKYKVTFDPATETYKIEEN